MSSDYYYNTRIYKNFRPHTELRCTTVTGQKHSSNVAPGQYNKSIQRNTFLTTLSNNLLKHNLLQIINNS